MCGINGFNWEDMSLLARMNEATAHRGPDSTGAICEHGMSLGHNRLAIIDLSPNGAQPMRSASGKSVVVFNGEIYNYQDIKKELVSYPYKGGSDTEVILAAYEAWGAKAFERFNGIFAFALLDQTTGALMLVRDRAGVKPLYYSWDGSRLIFSSEMKAILEHDVPRTLDRESFLHYLRLLYVPGPRTMIAGIHKLEPGHMLTLVGTQCSVERFVSDVRVRPDKNAVSDAGLRAVIDAAVERQLVSDRPLGIYLSGGFDSSIILDSMSRVQKSINSYSVGFSLGSGESVEKYNADIMLARKTAAHYGTTHHEVMLSSIEAAREFEDMVWHLDEPIGNPTSIAMLHLARFTKKTATVVTGGDGGDELFGGYPRYRLSLMSSYYRMLPTLLRAVLNRIDVRFAKFDTAPGIDRFERFLFQKNEALLRVLPKGQSFDFGITRRFFDEKFFSHEGGDFEDVFMDTDRQSWLIDESLMRSDKMSMAAAIEARVPFLDNEVIEYAERIPRSEKVTLLETKRMLKRAFRGRLPEFLYNEPKRGWFSPAAKWLRHEEFGVMAGDILSPTYYAETASLFDWQEVRAMLETHKFRGEYHLTMLWAIMVFQSWARQYKVRV